MKYRFDVALSKKFFWKFQCFYYDLFRYVNSSIHIEVELVVAKINVLWRYF